MNRINFKRVLDAIKADPDSWNQSVWHCGTVHCFAGHAQILAGHPVSPAKTRWQAIEFLEIDDYESDYLFNGRRTLEDFEHALAKGCFDESGYDREGYDASGFDREGLDRRGFILADYSSEESDRD